jgi:hypothetical protein
MTLRVLRPAAAPQCPQAPRCRSAALRENGKLAIPGVPAGRVRTGPPDQGGAITASRDRSNDAPETSHVVGLRGSSTEALDESLQANGWLPEIVRQLSDGGVGAERTAGREIASSPSCIVRRRHRASGVDGYRFASACVSAYPGNSRIGRQGVTTTAPEVRHQFYSPALRCRPISLNCAFCSSLSVL